MTFSLAPPRSTLNTMGSPTALVWMAGFTSSLVVTSLPSTASMRSPGRSCPFAGPDKLTEDTIGISVTDCPAALRAATVAFTREESIMATASFCISEFDFPAGYTTSRGRTSESAAT